MDSENKKLKNRINELKTQLAGKEAAIQSLQDQKELISKAVDLQLDTFFVFDPINRQAVHWNDAFQKTSGYSNAEIAAMPAPDSYYNSEDLEKAARFIPEVIATGSGRIVLSLITKDGRSIPTEYQVSIIKSEDGQPKHMVSIGRDISSRLKFEEALKMERDRAQLYLDLAGNIILALDREGTVSLINRKGAEILGCSKEDILGRNWFENYLPEALREDVSEVFQSLMRGDIKPVEFYENPVVNSSGEERTIAWYNSLIHSNEGAIIGTLSSGEDVTERKKIEESLKSSVRILHEIHDAVITTKHDSDFTITSWNRGAEQIYGWTGDEILGKSAFMLNNEYPNGDSQGTLDELLATGQFEGEVIQSGKDGRRINIDSHVMAIRNETGTILSWLAVNRDISGRKVAERALLESEERLRSLFDNLSSGVAIFRSENKGRRFFFVNINKAGEKIVKMERSAIIDRQVDEIFPGVKPFGLFDVFKKVWQTGKPANHPTAHYEDEKLSFWVDNYVYKLPTGEIVSIFEDVTEIKRAEEESSRLQARMNQYQRLEAVGTLAGGIAHDFNNILAAILGFTELSLADLENPPMLRNNLQEIFKGGLRARDLVKQILTFSQQQSEDRKAIPVRPIFEEARNLLRASLPATIKITMAAKSEARIWASETEIHQVIMNLCTNAGQAMQDKGGLLDMVLDDIRIDADLSKTLGLIEPGKYVKLTIRDSGRGMSAKVLERIFEPFFSTRSKNEGSGLGLSVVHGIVKSLSGTVAVASKPGKGSTFTVYIPASQAESNVETDDKKPITRGSGHILFIDDESALVQVGKRMLESLGYRVSETSSSIEAYERFQSNPDDFDLVITDMTMPGMTGDKLARKILKIRPDIPIILCTGFSEQIDETRATKLGIREYLLKPVQKRKLAETITRILNKNSN